jgi:hypothetical protein
VKLRLTCAALAASCTLGCGILGLAVDETAIATDAAAETAGAGIGTAEDAAALGGAAAVEGTAIGVGTTEAATEAVTGSED